MALCLQQGNGFFPRVPEIINTNKLHIDIDGWRDRMECRRHESAGQIILVEGGTEQI